MKDTNVNEDRERDSLSRPAAAAKVLAAWPDNDWRLIFVLARWGGLRTPSEALAEGAEFVVSRYRDSRSKLRTQMSRIIKLAGLEP